MEVMELVNRYINNSNLIIEIIRRNIMKRGYPIYIPNKALYGWIDEDFPRDGEYFFYTGLMYQMAPYIERIVNMLQKLRSGVLFKVINILNRVVDVSRFSSKPSHEEVMKMHKIIRNIYSLVYRSGLSVWYDPSIDKYAGVLLYEFGLMDDLKIYAERISDALSSMGVNKIVTIDPHTTYMFKKVFPSLLENYSIEAYSYLELIDEDIFVGSSAEQNKFVIHDPCYYARGVGVFSEPRKLLDRIGVEYIEPKFNRVDTYCCGGPVESLSPLFSAKIGVKRLGMLVDTGANEVITMCPICMANFRRVSKEVNIIDLSELISKYIK